MIPIIKPKMRTMAATAMPPMTGGSRASSSVVVGGVLVAAWGIFRHKQQNT